MFGQGRLGQEIELGLTLQLGLGLGLEIELGLTFRRSPGVSFAFVSRWAGDHLVGPPFR